MLFYRIKQFYWAMESIVIKEDFEILNKYLSKDELDLFMRMKKSERQHSIRVCKSSIEYIKDKNKLNINMSKMCKCTLLHDIGKSQVKLNVISKSINTIINSITYGKFLKYNNNKRIMKYHRHPEIGAKLLQDIGEYDLDIINCVKYHHNKDKVESNIYLEILCICDDCN